MSDKFYLSVKSTNKLPGEGANEIADPCQYESLANIADWRRTLSNLHTEPFFWRGYTWNSIEHAFQAMKIGLQDTDKAYHFTVESGHRIGKGDGAAAQSHRKHATLTQENIDLWSRTSESVLQGAAMAKYAQSAAASLALDDTGDAELWHVARRGRVCRSRYLENIRTRRRAAAHCAPIMPHTDSLGLPLRKAFEVPKVPDVPGALDVLRAPKPPKGDTVARAAREARALARSRASEARDEKDEDDRDDGADFYIKYHTTGRDSPTV